MNLRKLSLPKYLTRIIVACACIAVGTTIISFSALEIDNSYKVVKHEYSLANNAKIVTNKVGYKKPSPALTLNNFNSLISNDEASVVKIIGYNGCPDIIEGSGFVVAPDLVATNAHVIAGINNPTIVDGSRSYAGTPVYFDPELDFAVIRVNNLPYNPLPLNYSGGSLAFQGSHNGDQDIVLGYPNADSYKPVLATITGDFDTYENDIYGNPNDSQDILQLNSDIVHGNSGSPIVQQNGQVAGVVFGTSISDNTTAYAIPTYEFYEDVQQAEKTFMPVSTQTCIQETNN